MEQRSVPRSSKRRVVVLHHDPAVGYDVDWSSQLVVTARCGHRWSTGVSKYPDDQCVLIERMLDRHESLCQGVE